MSAGADHELQAYEGACRSFVGVLPAWQVSSAALTPSVDDCTRLSWSKQ